MTAGPDLAFLDETLPTVEENLALDEALLIEADEGRSGPLLRFWMPDGLAVVLGASRRIARDVNVEACRSDRVPIVRRSSGGGTVVIGPGVLNATVVLPQSAAPGLGAVDTAQRFVLDRMAAALSHRVPDIEVRGSGDLVLQDRKVAGSAQRRLKHWFLVHISLLCEFPLERVSRYLLEPDRQPSYRGGRVHGEFLRNLEAPRRIVGEVIRQAWCPPHLPSPVAGVPRELLENLLAERFANRSWIERL
jgi:lipoate-protein ligase A